MKILGKSLLQLLLLILFVFVGCSPRKEGSVLKDINQAIYKVGDVWSYKARPGEKESYITVVKVESHDKLGNIIHISVDGVKIKNPLNSSGFTESIQHMPFSEDAVTKSVIQKLRVEEKLPDYKSGYQEWRKNFDAGKGEIFTMTIAEAVSFVEEAMNNPSFKKIE